MLLLTGLLAGLIIATPSAAASTAPGCDIVNNVITCEAVGTTAYTPAPEVLCVQVDAWGGGGGGGGSSSAGYGAGGGAGGAFARGWVPTGPGNPSPYSVTVGAGGNGGTTAGTAGTPGQLSEFQSTISVIAGGGAPGAGSTSNNISPGGTGSTASSVGEILFRGGHGGIGVTTPGFGTGGGGGGGAGPTSQGGDASLATMGLGAAGGGGDGGQGGQSPGQAGFSFGGGGSGAAYSNGANPGGAGAQGRVIITEFTSYTDEDSSIEVSPPGVPADGSPIAVTVRLGTPCGPLGGQQVTLTSSRGGLDTITPATAPTNGAGEATFTISSNACGTSTLTARALGRDMADNPTVSFASPSGATAEASTVVASPTTVPANGASTSSVTVTVNTPAGCPVIGKSVSLTSSRGATDTITPGTAQTTDGTGSVVFAVSSNDWEVDSGLSTFTATVADPNGFTVVQTATVEWMIPISEMRFITPPTDTGRGLPFRPDVRVLVLDEAGDPWSSGPLEVTLTAAGGPGSLVNGPGQDVGLTDPVALTGAGGVATFSGVAVNAAGLYTLQAQIGTVIATSPPFEVGLTGPPWRFFGKDGTAASASLPGLADMETSRTVQTLPGTPGQPVRASPIVADLNGDGLLDLAFVNDVAEVAGSMVVRTYFQQADGSLAAGWTYTIPTEAPLGLPAAVPNIGFANLAAGVIDGQVRVVAYSQYSAGNPLAGTVNAGARLTVLNGDNGDAVGFLGINDITFARNIPPLIGDVTGDGQAEVVFLRDPNSGGRSNLVGVRVIDNTLTNVFDTSLGTPHSSSNLAMVDLDPSRPGLEVIVASDAGNAAGSSLLRICTPAVGNANCDRSIATSTGVRGIAVADVDGDGNPQVLVNGRWTNGGSFGLQVFDTTPSLALRQNLADGYQWNSPTAADIDGDGGADIINVDYHEFVDITHNIAPVTVWGPGATGWNKGSLTLTAGTPVDAIDSRGGGMLVDVDLDGVPEFIFGSADGRLNAVSVRDSSTTSPPTMLWQASLVPGGGALSAPAAGDLSGDCRPQVVVGLATGDVSVLSGAAAVLPGAPRWSDGATDYTSSASWSGADPPTSPGSGLQAKLAWLAPTTDGGLPVVEYLVFRGTDPAFTASESNRIGAWPSGTPPTPDTPFIDDTIPAEGDYYYKVGTVTCLSLKGGPGTVDGSVVMASSFQSEVRFPEPPGSLTATITTGDQPAYNGPAEVTVSWTAPAPNLDSPHGCGPVDGYNVYRDGVLLDVSPVTTTTLAEKLPIDASYAYSVHAINCVGEESVGAQATVDLQLPPTPDAPILTAFYAPDRVTVEWSAVTPANACGWIEGYRVHRATNGGPFTLLANVHAGAAWAKTGVPTNPGAAPLQYEDTAVTQVNTYHYRISAVNCVGEGIPGDTASILFENAGNPQITSVTPNIGPIAGGTTVTISGVDFVDGASVTFGSAPAASVTWNNPTQITAITPGHAPGSVAVTVTNPGGEPVIRPNGFRFVAPPTIDPFTATAVDSTEMRVEWTINTDGVAVSAIRLHRGTDPLFTMPGTIVADPDPTAVSHLDTGLDPGQEYCYRLRVTDSVGNVATSVPTCDTTQEVSNDPTIGPLTATGTSTTTIDLVWGQAVSPIGEQLTKIEVFRDGLLLVTIPNATATSYQDTGRVPATQHCYLVRVTDLEGRTGDSEEECAQAHALTGSPAPRIDTITPNIGTVAGGTNVVIQGQNFIPGAKVFFGLFQGTVNAVTPTQVYVTTPAQAPATVNVRVVNVDAQSDTKVGGFRYVAPPVIDPFTAATTVATSVDLAWAITPDGVAVTDILVFRGPLGFSISGDTYVDWLAGSDTTFIDTGLDDDTRYCYRLAVFDEAENIAISVERCGTTFPAAPITLVAVGQDGTILTSPDGVDWSPRSTGTKLSGVAHGDGVTVAVGNRATILTSTDALHWNTANGGLPELALSAIAYADGMFLAVGDDGTLRSSTDGITWTVATGPEPLRNLLGVAHNGLPGTQGQWVVVGAPPNPSGGPLPACPGPGCAPIFTSPDGVTWTARDSGTQERLNGITHNGLPDTDGLWVAVGDDGRIVHQLSQGAGSQLSATSYETGRPCVPFAGGFRFFDANSDGFFDAGDILYIDSDNSNTITAGDIILSGPDAGTIVIGALATGLPLADGAGTVSFYDADSNGQFGPGDVLYYHDPAGTGPGGPLFVEPGDVRLGRFQFGTSEFQFGSIVAMVDADAWSPLVSGGPATPCFYDEFDNDFFDLNEQAFLAAGATLATNDVRITGAWSWSVVMSPTSENLHDVTHDGNRFIAVGDDGTIIRSTAGTDGTWTVVGTPTTEPLNAVMAHETILLAVGDNGTILRSVNGGASWAAQTSHTKDHLLDVTHDGNRFIIVGAGGRIITSLDGADWTPRTPGTQLSGVAHGNGTTVAVGNRATILTSTDALQWNGADGGLPELPLSAIAYANGKFLAVGGDGTLRSSEDGVTWTVASSPTPLRNLLGVAHNGLPDTDGRWVVVGAPPMPTPGTPPPCTTSPPQTAGCAPIYTSPDGITWATQNSGTAQRLNGITHNGLSETDGLWVAVGDDGRIRTSGTGIGTWSVAMSPNSANLNDVTHDGNRFIAVGDDGTIIRSASGTNSWAVVATPTTQTLHAVMSHDAILLAVGDGGTILRSVNGGANWATQTSHTIGSLLDVTHDGTYFIVVGEGGRILTSPDGITWTIRATGVPSDLHSVTQSPFDFTAVGKDGTIITSPSAFRWVTESSGTPTTLNDVVYGAGRVVAVGNAGEVHTSVNGITWTPQVSGTDQPLFGIGYGNGLFVAVGENIPIRTSPDGITWTPLTSSGNMWLNKVIYEENLFVAVGDAASASNGMVVKSSDGSSWTGQTLVGSGGLQGVARGNGVWVAVTETGRIYSSSNTNVWTLRDSGVTTPLWSITFDGNQFVAVGSGGTVITSPNGITWTPQESTTLRDLFGIITVQQMDLPDVEQIVITANPNQINAGGFATSQIKVELRDSNGEPFKRGGFRVCLVTTLGTLTNGDPDQSLCPEPGQFAPVDHRDGNYSATLVSSTGVGIATITGFLDTRSIQDWATVKIIAPTPPAPPQVGAINDLTVTAGTTIQFKVFGSHPQWPVTWNMPNGLPHAGATFTDNGDGSGTFKWVTDTSHVGVYTGILFNASVTDGYTVVSVDRIISITVKSPPPPAPAPPPPTTPGNKGTVIIVDGCDPAATTQLSAKCPTEDEGSADPSNGLPGNQGGEPNDCVASIDEEAADQEELEPCDPEEPPGTGPGTNPTGPDDDGNTTIQQPTANTPEVHDVDALRAPFKESKKSPGLGVLLLLGALVGLIAVRRRQA